MGDACPRSGRSRTGQEQVTLAFTGRSRTISFSLARVSDGICGFDCRLQKVPRTICGGKDRKPWKPWQSWHTMYVAKHQVGETARVALSQFSLGTEDAGSCTMHMVGMGRSNGQFSRSLVEGNRSCLLGSTCRDS